VFKLAVAALTRLHAPAVGLDPRHDIPNFHELDRSRVTPVAARHQKQLGNRRYVPDIKYPAQARNFTDIGT
jgi:hypothetical protein